jgi:RND family efflux transporter MFP subunit
MTESEKTTNPPVYGGYSPQQDPKPRKKLWILRLVTFVLPILVIVGAIGGTVAMGALKPEPEEKKEEAKAIPVLTALAEVGDVTLKVKAQGEVQPRTQINVVPQVGGKITYMSPKFIEGGKFNKGDLLVRIEPAEFNLRVVQARAGVTQAETVIMREKSEAEIARRDWEELGRSGEPSPLSLRIPQLAEAQANLESAKAQLAEAELQLSRTSIYAPFNGRVTERHIDQGEFVTIGTRLGQIYATDVMDVRLPLSNKDLREAGLTLGYEALGEAGIPVTLSSDVAGQYSEWTGYITRTDSRFDSQSRVLYAYAEVRNPFGKTPESNAPLAPGLFVDAKINGQAVKDVIFVPRSALRGEDQVYVANEDNTLSIKTVSVLSSNRDQAMLNGGLDIGAPVITSPIRGVADGMKIEVVERELATDAALVSGEQP